MSSESEDFQKVPPRPKGKWCNYHKGASHISNFQVLLWPVFSGWGARFTLVVLTFLGQALSYTARVDMSVAIVAMVDRSELSTYL